MSSGKFPRVAGLGLVLVIVTAAFLMGCGDSIAPLHMQAAPLVGANEVPANTSAGTGAAVVQFDTKTNSLTYTLTVQNINNVVQAHFHCCGAVSTNQPVVLFLFGPIAAGGGTTNGQIASGTKTGADLIGPMQGQPLQNLIDQIKQGNVYVNVHTSDGTKTSGPGNLPAGEIRAQVTVVNASN
jgi:CHRD domain.